MGPIVRRHHTKPGRRIIEHVQSRIGARAVPPLKELSNILSDLVTTRGVQWPLTLPW